ncbi:hypothetical protein B7P43_G00611, partial [Cryptotermes secundus]
RAMFVREFLASEQITVLEHPPYSQDLAPIPFFLFSKILHCVIHQQALCAKHADMSSVLKPVISIVNLIRCHAPNHRHFRSFLEECDSELTDLTCTAVRWLSCGKVLSRFFQFRNEIDIFLTEKNHHEPLLSDTKWLWKLALCEQTFSQMKYIKSKYRANLSNEHLKSLLVISVSKFEPQFNQILRMQKEFHRSH